MKRLIRTFIVSAAVIVAVTQLQNAVSAQDVPRETKPVVVVNTPDNPVPVTGSVQVTNTPTVEARQSGPWNVALEGTPTFKIDPNNNTVRMDPSVRAIDFHGFSHNWGQGQIYGVTQYTQHYSRLKVCVKNSPTGLGLQDALVKVLSRNLNGENISDFEIGRFFAPRSGAAVCNVHDLPGWLTVVSIESEVNTAGTVSLGLFGQPN